MKSAPTSFSPMPWPPLQPADAVVALLQLRDGRYVMQLRDDVPHVIYPGHWACFGGAVKPGEAATDTLRRELREELEFEAQGETEFAKFEFDLTSSGHGKFYRAYYEVKTAYDDLQPFVLREGADMRAFDGWELLRTPWVAPHDSFAVWLHLVQKRLVSPD